MTLFYTNSTKHLVSKIKLKKAKFTISKFSDGEIYVKIEENVKNKEVWVVASTNSPGDNLLELIFLLDALKREKAKINLLIPYFGYARQGKGKPGEAQTAKVVCDLLQGYKISVIHMHSPRIKKYLKFKNLIPLYQHIIKKYDIVIAPDKGAAKLVRTIGKELNIPYIIMNKVRPKPEQARITTKPIDVKNKKVLIIDDMISTGGTIIAASKKLQGATEISVLTTHGIFSGDALKKLSLFDKVYITNSLPQRKHPKLHILDLAPFISKEING